VLKCGINLRLDEVLLDCPNVMAMLILNKGGAELELAILKSPDLFNHPCATMRLR